MPATPVLYRGCENGDFWMEQEVLLFDCKLQGKSKPCFQGYGYGAGFSRVTVDELAARCGISKRTIYRYFKSKDEMIVTVMEEVMSEIEQESQRRLTLQTVLLRDSVPQSTRY